MLPDREHGETRGPRTQKICHVVGSSLLHGPQSCHGLPPVTSREVLSEYVLYLLHKLHNLGINSIAGLFTYFLQVMILKDLNIIDQRGM